MEKHLYYYPNHTAFLAVTNNPNLHNVVYCDNEAHVHYDYHDYSQDYFTTVAREDGTISFNIWKSMGTDMITSISYSTDNGETWTTTANTDNKTANLVINVNVNEGDKIMWKGDTTQTADYGNDVVSYFSSTCDFDAQGNIMSLLYGDDFKDKTTIETEGCFYYLFSGFEREFPSKLVDASKVVLPAETLSDHCYEYMFAGCTSLTTAPELPAITLTESCYYGMFYGCSNLITAPILPATTLTNTCYAYMFAGCTSLTTAPELPAITLTEGCYNGMFRGCTSLTIVPALPATTLIDICYYEMFRGCTSLTTAPELPAETLAYGCYAYMFEGCTSLTSAPELPAITLTDACYNSMFESCANLNYIKAMFTTTPSTDYTSGWVEGVASSGTFVKNSVATWNVSGVNGVPNGWTVETASN